MILGVVCRSRKLLPLIAVCILARSAFCEIIFDNLVTPQTDATGHPLTTDGIKHPELRGEFGDEIVMAGTSRTITDFFFYYYADFVSTGPEAVKVRFYKNDLPYSLGSETIFAPGTLIYESNWRPINSTAKENPPYEKIAIQPVGGNDQPVIVPDDFTYTVEFRGVTFSAGSEASLIYYGPIAKGSSFDDYWQRQPNGAFKLWTLNPTPPYLNPKSNFGVLIQAVPEPGILGVGILGGLAFLALRRGKSRSA